MRIQPAGVTITLTTPLYSFVNPAPIVEQGNASTLSDNVVGRIDITTSKLFPLGDRIGPLTFLCRLCWPGVEHRQAQLSSMNNLITPF